MGTPHSCSHFPYRPASATPLFTLLLRARKCHTAVHISLAGPQVRILRPEQLMGGAGAWTQGGAGDMAKALAGTEEAAGSSAPGADGKENSSPRRGPRVRMNLSGEDGKGGPRCLSTSCSCTGAALSLVSPRRVIAPSPTHTEKQPSLTAGPSRGAEDDAAPDPQTQVMQRPIGVHSH